MELEKLYNLAIFLKYYFPNYYLKKKMFLSQLKLFQCPLHLTNERTKYTFIFEQEVFFKNIKYNISNNTTTLKMEHFQWSKLYSS